MEKSDFIVWASKLQASYRPSKETLEKIANTHLIAVVGPTGVGKSTLIDELGIPEVLSDVSRSKRPDEKDDESYHFRSDYLSIIKDIKEGKYVQFVISPTGEFYGTRAEEYEQNGTCIMAIMASAIPVFKEVGFKKITQLYVMPPSYVEWMRRIGGVRTEDLLGRISEARGSLALALEDSNYQFILNDTIENALDDVVKILNDEEVNEHRQQLAIGTADVLLERIGSGEE